MRQIVITEKMLDQLVGEAQDRLRSYTGGPNMRPPGDSVSVERAKEIIKRLGEDIKDSTL